MAYDGLGYFSIAAGETLIMSVWFGDAAPDLGPLYFSVHPLEPGGPLVSSRQRKLRDPQGRTFYGSGSPIAARTPSISMSRAAASSMASSVTRVGWWASATSRITARN